MKLPQLGHFVSYSVETNVVIIRGSRDIVLTHSGFRLSFGLKYCQRSKSKPFSGIVKIQIMYMIASIRLHISKLDGRFCKTKPFWSRRGHGYVSNVLIFSRWWLREQVLRPITRKWSQTAMAIFLYAAIGSQNNDCHIPLLYAAIGSQNNDGNIPLLYAAIGSQNNDANFPPCRRSESKQRYPSMPP